LVDVAVAREHEVGLRLGPAAAAVLTREASS
jgi:hypothetical protein